MHPLLLLLIFIIILIIILCILYAFAGCRDPDAMNYNKFSIFHNEDTCQYASKGCMDPNFANYNKYATISCSEDCKKCGQPGQIDCQYCEHQESCTDCAYCLCLAKKPGCLKSWALNHDPNANFDDGSCIDLEELMKRIYVVTTPKETIMKINGTYAINGGEPGLNILVLQRDQYLSQRYAMNYRTGESQKEAQRLQDFFRDKVNDTDIVIVASQGAWSKFVDLDTKLTLDMIGNQTTLFNNDSSYLLIGSKARDIYYESQENNGAMFPDILLSDMGCLSVSGSTLDPEKYKFLKVNDLNSSLHKCALEIDYDTQSHFAFNVSTNDTNCIPLDQMPIKSTEDCPVRIYKISHKTTDGNKIYENQDTRVSLYDDEGWSGNLAMMPTGEYVAPFIGGNGYIDNRALVSIKVPRDFIVDIFDDEAHFLQIAGPARIPNMDTFKESLGKYQFSRATKVIINYVKDQIVFFSDTYYKGTSFGVSYGRTILPDYLIGPVKSVKQLYPNVKITLYSDAGFLRPIKTLDVPDTDVIGYQRDIDNLNLRQRVSAIQIDRV